MNFSTWGLAAEWVSLERLKESNKNDDEGQRPLDQKGFLFVEKAAKSGLGGV